MISGLPGLSGRFGRPSTSSGRLQPLAHFGSNPGNLQAWHFAPESERLRPLVVVLHGCTQTADGYDIGSGWSDLAQDAGFAVLYPEQSRTNNAQNCFNWFEPGDTRRGAGEALSIAQMIDAMVADHQVDPARVYITGLSAGGAMTSVMLATYPEKFAGGAILAGLPHGAAASVAEALQQMRAPSATSRSSGQAISNASAHAGHWPTISVWHGTADAVVHPSNADAILQQWREVHGLPEQASETGLVDSHPYRAWRGADGALLLEEYRVTGMGHGTPLATAGECGCGEAGAFMLEAGISSTLHSARTWGIAEIGAPKTVASPAAAQTPEAKPLARLRRMPEVAGVARPSAKPVPAARPESRVAQVIEDALRSAGLMK